ncbi:LysM peptidoglycan-binding domain-containing protein [Paenibacillus sp. MCAF9]|uniref:LysM peptidoglycan-binding domain-containing protein n=1 Tax=Paenibacillus sp. MCAF9 TaxID=3233046 RepID=UPI003F993075
MNQKITRSNNRQKGSFVSLKKTTLIIYLAIVIILIGVCGVLYGKYLSVLDFNLQSAVANKLEQSNEQALNNETANSNSSKNANGGLETITDELIPAGSVDEEEKQESTEEKQDTNTGSKPVETNNPNPPVKETVKTPDTSKPVVTEKPDKVEKPVQEPKESDKPTGSSNETIKLPTTYIVQKGDTLSSISEKFYQSKDHYALLAEHNHILFINDMKAGDKLTIPALSSGTGSTGGSSQGSKDYSKITLPATYLVQAGDTLSSISKMFYKSAEYVSYIAQENKIDKNAGLKAGSNLIIPSLKNYKKEEDDSSWGVSPGFETVDHTVKNGETLYSISKTYYGSNKYAMFIADFNQIVDIDNVKAGTVLKIPK